ncbi:CDP-alcohol phosphatidyltransferase family protein [Flavobacterium ginsenosidimutans]|uniref:CDP-alcohol phosphatidyltransferase family protein n=1 Tax=Flavobacterium ginsenosidimutans TaxID=687844 RepID=A0ABZ2QF70_9FLAO|nr:CDP-alcohol phosphatidyltransferase family protein [Flavobacterium ginsenosidimutans]KAF2329701.1 CDP-alcohol phosphatidyltransferase family protein [Flavobacterium ginsenosidimutans]
MKNLPILLIGFRLLLGPVLILLTYNFGSELRKELVVLIFLGLLSDIFDGIVARRLSISSEKLRRMDSQTDLVFWLCVAWCSWLLNPEIIKENAVAIAVIFIMEAMTYFFSFLKFGKETCTHALLSKFWGITLLLAFVGMIGFGYSGITFSLAVIFGIIGHIDVLLIILILPKWTFDVPSCYHAYLIRKGIPFKKNKLFN